MKRFIILTLILLALPQISAAQIASGGGFSLEKSVIASGGGEGVNGAFNMTGTTGQSAAGAVTTSHAVFRLANGFWTPDQLAPTAALVSIGGKVTTADGNGIRNAVVTLTDTRGAIRTTYTGTFGRFTFADLEVGGIYVLTVSTKKYVFSNPTRVISVSDGLNDLDFIGDGL
jgi:hypothetical protein